jgi:flagellin
MGLRVNTNVTSMKAMRALSETKGSMDQTMNRLSSGSRINTSSEDAAGLAISENLKAQMRGLKQSTRNAQDGISMIQIAEGGLNEVANILVRLRELGIQSASDTISDNERGMVEVEYRNMVEEIDRIAATTEFNGTNLLSGINKMFDFQINTKNSPDADRITFDGSMADVGTLGLGISDASVADKFSAQDSLSLVDNAINHVNRLRANLGAIQSRLNSTSENLLQSIENTATANSRIRDADIAEESTALAKHNIMMQSGTAILAQSNQQNALALQLLKGA